SFEGPAFLKVDLGASTTMTYFTVRHAGAGGELTDWDTKDFDLQVSTDGTNFTTVAQVRGNTSDVTDTAVNATGRFVRVNVITPTSSSDGATRLYELEVYG